MTKYFKFNDLKLINLQRIITMLMIQIILKSLNAPDQNHKFANVNNPQILLIVPCYKNYILTVGMKEIEDSTAKFIQRSHNKFMHMLNGNKKVDKHRSHYKIYQINKGNSDFGTFVYSLHREILKSRQS